MTEFRPSRFEILPVVIKNLVIINVLFFLAQYTLSKTGIFDLESQLGLHDVNSPLFHPWQIVTHLFLHSTENLFHLFSNMFALWMFGSILENIWGPKRFITFYFLCGIGAGLLQLVSLWFQHHDMVQAFVAIRSHPTPEGVNAFFDAYGISQNPSAMEVLKAYYAEPGNHMISNELVNFITRFTNTTISYPTIGASGAVFGILAAFVYLFPNTYIYLYFLVPIKAKWIGLAYFTYEVISAILNQPGNNIAHWAHVGGGIVGFLLVLTWNKTNRRRFY